LAELRLNCPRPHNGAPDTGKHLYFNDEKQVWFCFSCGYRGYGPCPSDDEGVIHTGTREIKISRDSRPLHDLLISGQSGLIISAARRYLESHHVNPEEISFKRRLLLDGRYLIFPIYRGEKVVYFQKRDLFHKAFYNPPVDNKPLFWTHEDNENRPVFLD